MDQLNLLVIINAGTLATVFAFGYKVIRFINRIEFKTDIMWDDYERRVGHTHKRSTDPDEE